MLNNIDTIKQQVIERSGRYDLVVDAIAGDYSDAGIDAYLRSALNYCDLKYGWLKPLNTAVIPVTGSSVSIAGLSYIEQAWLKGASDDAYSELKNLTIFEAKDKYTDFDSLDSSTPTTVFLDDHYVTTLSRNLLYNVEQTAFAPSPKILGIVSFFNHFVVAYTLNNVSILFMTWTKERGFTGPYDYTLTGGNIQLQFHNEVCYYITSNTTLRVGNVFAKPISLTAAATYFCIDTVNSLVYLIDGVNIKSYTLSLTSPATLFTKPTGATYMTTDGSHLFFIVNGNTLAKYTLAGVLVKIIPIGESYGELSYSAGYIVITSLTQTSVLVYNTNLDIVDRYIRDFYTNGNINRGRLGNGKYVVWLDNFSSDTYLFNVYDLGSSQVLNNVRFLPPTTEDVLLKITGRWKDLISTENAFFNFWIDKHPDLVILAVEREFAKAYNNRTGVKEKDELIAEYCNEIDNNNIEQDIRRYKPVRIEG